MRLPDDNLRGRVVISGDGIAIGEITRVFIDSAEWRVDALQVKLRKDSADRLGASRTWRHAASIEIPTRVVQSVGDAVILAVPLASLRLAEQPRPSESAPAH